MKNLYKVGQKVWVNLGRNVIQVIISKQEWWKANPDHPVYYQIKLNGMKLVPPTPTGWSWHFNDIYKSKRAALRQLPPCLVAYINNLETCR